MENGALFAEALIVVGALLLVAILADALHAKLRLPRVTLLLLLGIALGPAVLDVLPENRQVWSPLITHLALVMIGFLLGSEFRFDFVRRYGRRISVIALVEAGVTALTVLVGLSLLSVEVPAALALAAIAAATAPAATLAVLQEAVEDGASKNSFVQALEGVVALDDVFSLLLFSAAVSLVANPHGGSPIQSALLEIGGGLLLGVALGLPLAALTGRVRPGQATTLEALGAVALATGLALQFEVSPLLTAMAMGAMLTNLARHHSRAFHEIENLEVPFLALFFLLAGAALEMDNLGLVSTVAIGYLVLRSVGKVTGGWLGGSLAGLGSRSSALLGASLLPQAGVALGLALTASERIPEHAEVILTVVIVATVVFELFGPPLTHFAVLAEQRRPSPPR